MRPRPRRPGITLADELGRVRLLGDTRRVFVAVVFMVPAILMFAGLMSVSGGWPYLAPHVRHEGAYLLALLSIVVLVPWLGVGALAWVGREHSAPRPVLVYATVQLYAVTCALFTIVTGFFDSPGWILFLGGALVGFMLFDSRAILSAALTYGLMVIGTAGAVASRAMHLDAVLTSLAGERHLEPGAVLRLGLLSVAFSAITLLTTSAIVDRWRSREKQLELLSRTDPLTGLANRRRFMDVAERLMALARRHARPIAVVIVDLDHFKSINDRLGHVAGDVVLTAAAGVLRDTVRQEDVAARWGGEEFALLLPDTGADGATEVATRCQRKLAETPIDAGTGERIRVTASFGVAVLSGAKDDLGQMLRRADAALYRAKGRGRNRVETEPPPVTASADET